MDGYLCIWLLYGGHGEVVELLISKGTNIKAVDKDGYTPLHWVVQMVKKEVVELLISKGADVRAGINNGCTPLHLAAEQGHKEVVELLIAKGANIWAMDKNYKEHLIMLKKQIFRLY